MKEQTQRPAYGTTPDRAHPHEPAAAPLVTDDEAAGSPGAARPEPHAGEPAPRSQLVARPASRWRQFGAVLLLVLLIIALFAVPIFLR